MLGNGRDCTLHEGKCLISIAAGVSRDFLKKYSNDAHIIRVMPNTPLLVGYGGTSAVTPRRSIPMHHMMRQIQYFPPPERSHVSMTI
jgi:pyrroline-5-carboxylate reductase